MRLEFARIHYSAETRLSASSSPQPTGEPGYEAKVTRYEQEKTFMERLRGVSCTVGEYIGDGQGEQDSVTVNSQQLKMVL